MLTACQQFSIVSGMKCKRCNGSGQEIDHRALGNGMRLERNRLRLGLRAVAEVMGKSAQYVCDLERGYRAWNADLIKAYKKALR